MRYVAQLEKTMKFEGAVSRWSQHTLEFSYYFDPIMDRNPIPEIGISGTECVQIHLTDSVVLRPLPKA